MLQLILVPPIGASQRVMGRPSTGAGAYPRVYEDAEARDLPQSAELFFSRRVPPKGFQTASPFDPRPLLDVEVGEAGSTSIGQSEDRVRIVLELQVVPLAQRYAVDRAIVAGVAVDVVHLQREGDLAALAVDQRRAAPAESVQRLLSKRLAFAPALARLPVAALFLFPGVGAVATRASAAADFAFIAEPRAAGLGADHLDRHQRRRSADRQVWLGGIHSSLYSAQDSRESFTLAQVWSRRASR